ncbi:hypothetical protein FA13DRAFT_1703809 [Coprinellus micaceus]|uniref:Uncharacterized protein n=1 Tax=Coprinellus micaceus TaxID=71717 RepID=A0A4Y7TZA0_COPMI|nr:hypothetical protein FA13DRAFT_1703809 [Coprinellus micaceus]
MTDNLWESAGTCWFRLLWFLRTGVLAQLQLTYYPLASVLIPRNFNGILIGRQHTPRGVDSNSGGWEKELSIFSRRQWYYSAILAGQRRLPPGKKEKLHRTVAEAPLTRSISEPSGRITRCNLHHSSPLQSREVGTSLAEHIRLFHIKAQAAPDPILTDQGGKFKTTYSGFYLGYQRHTAIRHWVPQLNICHPQLRVIWSQSEIWSHTHEPPDPIAVLERPLGKPSGQDQHKPCLYTTPVPEGPEKGDHGWDRQLDRCRL